MISIDIEASRNNTNMPQSAETINIVIKTKVKQVQYMVTTLYRNEN